jgi:hypothetical protein
VTDVYFEPADLRRAVASSSLVRAGGVAVVRLLSELALNELRAEALDCHSSAGSEARVEAAHDEQRGNPDRWIETAVGGPALQRFMYDPCTLATVGALVGVPCRPLAGTGTYSFYRRDGHFLGLHRDITYCDVAAITCVDVRGNGTGGDLEVFPSLAAVALSESRRRLSDSGRLVALASGDTAVVLGSVVPHRVVPISGDRVRIVAPICYAFAQRPG